MSYIALLGEYDSTFTPHVATGIAIRHSSAVLGTAIKGEWVSTQDIDESLFSHYSGLWVAPGSPYKNLEKTITKSNSARRPSATSLSFAVISNLERSLRIRLSNPERLRGHTIYRKVH